MFNRLMNEKNRYILVNIIFTLVILALFLLVIALLKDSAIGVISDIFSKIGSSTFLSILLILYTGIYIIFLIYNTINQKNSIKCTINYLSAAINTIQIFHFAKVKYYFSRLTIGKVLFIKKFIFIFAYIILIAMTIYSIVNLVKFIWKIVRKRILDFDAPKINGDTLKTVIGLYYLDFEYNKNLTYYVTYEGNGKIIREDISSNKLLCLVGELMPDVEYNIKLHSLGKLKARFVSLESKETVKFSLNHRATDLQERVSYYYHYSPNLIECYISIMQIFDKMFKRLLNNSPEVYIIDSLNKKNIFAKIYLDKENIVVRFNENPFLLEEEFRVINAFEEDCMYPTKYIVRSVEDVDYLKKIVEKIKSMKK